MAAIGLPSVLSVLSVIYGDEGARPNQDPSEAVPWQVLHISIIGEEAASVKDQPRVSPRHLPQCTAWGRLVMEPRLE